MPPQTHYTTLSLPPTASPSSIRTAYKSLARTSHPRKTMHLPASARAAHAALFRRVQEAYDVLGKPALREAYDRELAREGEGEDVGEGGREVVTDIEREAEIEMQLGGEGVGSGDEEHTAGKDLLSSEADTPQGKLRARVDAEIAAMRTQRARRDAEDAELNGEGLRGLLAIWVNKVGEFEDEVGGEGEMRAWCAVQVQVYLHKFEERGERLGGGKEAREEAKIEDITREERRGVTREKERREAARLARIEAKVEAVRREKGMQRVRLEERNRREAERVAHVREKAGARVVSRGERRDSAVEGGVGADVARPSSSRKKCTRCGAEHKGFVEWKKCARDDGVVDKEVEDEEKFFRTV